LNQFSFLALTLLEQVETYCEGKANLFRLQSLSLVKFFVRVIYWLSCPFTHQINSLR
jgi:hypothetical protein